MANPQAASRASSSSSSIHVDSIDRSGVMTDEDERKLRSRLIRLGYGPDAWCSRRRADEREVIALMRSSPLETPLMTAMELLGQFGEAACEGAAVKAIAHIRSHTDPKKVRTKVGLMISFLKKGSFYTPEMIDMLIDDEWEQAMRKVATEAESNPTLQRLLQEAETPANVTRIERRA
jgi:hypothetical protein